jgi:hypothetical protein
MSANERKVMAKILARARAAKKKIARSGKKSRRKNR